jgi:hypothetical protein
VFHNTVQNKTCRSRREGVTRERKFHRGALQSKRTNKTIINYREFKWNYCGIHIRVDKAIIKNGGHRQPQFIAWIHSGRPRKGRRPTNKERTCNGFWPVSKGNDKIYDIFVNCNWVATRWQRYNTHLHTNSTQNDTQQTVHRTTQKFCKMKFGRWSGASWFVLITKYYSLDQTKVNKMCGACSKYGVEEKYVQGFGEKNLEAKHHL